MTLLRIALLALGLAAPAAAGAVDLEQTAAAVVERTNRFREEQGLHPVKVDAALEAAAAHFARYMAKTGKYGHGADGRRPPERAAAQGYDYCIVSENIAYQYRSAGFGAAGVLAGALVEGWKNSPGHRRNMLERAVTETGVGVAQAEGGRYYAVQVFGRPRAASIKFTLRNRSGEKVEYRIGAERYSLPARVTRTHMICKSAQLAIGGRFRAQATDGASYSVMSGGEVSEAR
jgi:hypothetical protein